MKVDAKHPLYDAFLPRWQVCSDAVAGPHIMSQKADKYLCSLAEGNDSEQAKQRYKTESDPLFLEWQYDKTPESEQVWRDKVSEIKAQLPIGVSQ